MYRLCDDCAIKIPNGQTRCVRCTALRRATFDRWIGFLLFAASVILVARLDTPNFRMALLDVVLLFSGLALIGHGIIRWIRAPKRPIA